MAELRHVAIIPDGNRRWARANRLPVSAGHEGGVEALRSVLEKAHELGISHLSFWGASLANLAKRSAMEVRALERLYAENFSRLAGEPRMRQEGIRVRVLGDWERALGERARRSIRNAIRATEKHSRFSLNFFIAYDGAAEMMTAIQRIVDKARSEPMLTVTPQLVKESLYTRDLPAVDLMIRTGGEPHLSAGFMMWDIADCQLYFSDKLWPEFGGEDLGEAVADYHRRERRLGR